MSWFTETVQREEKPRTAALQPWAGLPERDRLRDCKSLGGAVTLVLLQTPGTVLLVSNREGSHPERLLCDTREPSTSPAVAHTMLRTP